MKKFYNYLTDTQSDNTFKSPLNLCVPQNLFFYCLELMHNLSSFLYFSTGFKELESHYLVPGDVFLLDGKKLSLPCDAVLHDLVEEHNKVQVTVCTKNEGESSVSHFPH